MNIDVRVEPALLETFPEIRLGCLHYTAKVEKTNPALWELVERETIPQVLRQLEELDLPGIEGIRCSREAYKAFVSCEHRGGCQQPDLSGDGPVRGLL